MTWSVTSLCKLLILLVAHSFVAHSMLRRALTDEAESAFKFLDSFLVPASGCKNIEYAISDCGGRGGGFASQFQVKAAHWLITAAANNYTLPVILRGGFKGYTAGKECKSVNHDYTCLFLPMSSCQHELMETGKLVQGKTSHHQNIHESMIPPQFAHRGLAWWWGIVQAKMFHLQPPVEEYINRELLSMGDLNLGVGFPHNSPAAGLHVRHGDKTNDGFRDHSFEAELNAIKKSTECTQYQDNCFLNISRNTLANKAPLAVYVASDDAKVVKAARSMGYLVTSGNGSSQRTGKLG